jgi:hypothetical protein
MKILVYPHHLGIGGSQLNAIEIAAQVSDLGHEVCVFGRPGPLVDRIEELGMEFLPAPVARRRPSPAVVGELSRIVRERQIDVLHGYEWPPALECHLASLRHQGTAAIATVMSMAVAPFLPRSMSLLVGTEQIAASERAGGRTMVSVLEPPVDLLENNPDRRTGIADFLRRWQIPEAGIRIVTVTRLAHEMKLEGLLAAMDAMADLPEVPQATMVIVGDGAARADVEQRAAEVNRRLDRAAVILTGEMSDPRPAYACADIFFGMGGSALRALAFGKPLVVQGEKGFWLRLTPGTLEQFLWTGWYGVGPGVDSGKDCFLSQMVPLMRDPDARTAAADLGLRVMNERFSLEAAAHRQIASYEAALVNGQGIARVPDLSRAALLYGRYALRRKYFKFRGTASTDDFNSAPVVATGPAAPSSGRT